jgi:uncharacterized membrane protein YkoI
MMLSRQALAILMAATIAPAALADKPIQKKDCPTAVRKTIDEQSKGATVRGISTETEDGKTYYELETTANGHSRDVLIDPAGKVVSVEEEVPVSSLPQAARAALETRGKILRAESVTKDGVVSYEAKIESNGKKSEVAVTADGVIKK